MFSRLKSFFKFDLITSIASEILYLLMSPSLKKIIES